MAICLQLLMSKCFTEFKSLQGTHVMSALTEAYLVSSEPRVVRCTGVDPAESPATRASLRLHDAGRLAMTFCSKMPPALLASRNAPSA